LFTRLKRCAYAPIAALALWAVVLAAWPATANAQATSPAKGPQVTDSATGSAERVVVAPGDSLWSMSARWLGPEATTRQIADGVERIYKLNQGQIGSNPDLIFAGQQLLLPSRVKQQAPEVSIAAPARRAGKATVPSPPSHASNNGTDDTAAGAAVGEADHKAKQKSVARSQPVSLPEPARVAPVAAARSVAPNDSPPTLAMAATSGARSLFSAGIAEVGEVFPHGPYSGRKLLGGALIAISTVLGIILVVRVAWEVWGPYYAKRRARKRWVREVLGRNHASYGSFATRDVYAAATVAFEGCPPSEGSPQSEARPAPAAEGSRTRAPARGSTNGSASSDDARKIARSRQARIRQTRPLKARRQPRGHEKDAVDGTRLGREGRRAVNRIQGARALSRKGDRIVGSEPRDPGPMQEWEIGEPLRRAIGGIPARPGAPVRDTLLEVMPLAADELTTVTRLEQRRGLSDKEQRQARALQRFLATVEEACGDERLR
jgi:hypothetical protein